MCDLNNVFTLPCRGKDRCRHYMIEMQTNGKYVILGEARAHPSLLDLIEYHKKVGILPFLELLTVPCGQVGRRSGRRDVSPCVYEEM